MLETVPITTAGTYSLVVGGDGGTTGNYTMQAILNAVYKQATDSINTIGTAYDLGSAFAGLGTTPSADRAGVVGTLSGTAGAINRAQRVRLLGHRRQPGHSSTSPVPARRP